jgi:anti-sigma factor RsiW
MNCHDCRQQLQARLDGEAVPADEIAAHLAACAECRALEAAAGRLQAALRLLPAPAPPAGLVPRIVSEISEDWRRRRRRRSAFAAAGMALAASLLLIASVAHLKKPGPQQQAWVDPHPPIKPQGQPRPAASLNDNMAEATSAVASLARRTADETVSNGQILVPAVSLPMTEPEVLGPPLEPPAQSLREAGHGVAVGLAPVTSSAARAFDLFRRDIAPMAPAGE